jgi:hypothetical protein
MTAPSNDPGEQHTGEPPTEESGNSNDNAKAAQFMTRLSVAMLNSGAHYSARWAQILAEYLPRFNEGFSLMAGDAANRADARLVLLDHFRAFVREMGELPAQESRRFVAELEDLAEDLWGQDGGEHGDWKRWRVKP